MCGIERQQRARSRPRGQWHPRHMLWQSYAAQPDASEGGDATLHVPRVDPAEQVVRVLPHERLLDAGHLFTGVAGVKRRRSHSRPCSMPAASAAASLSNCARETLAPSGNSRTIFFATAMTAQFAGRSTFSASIARIPASISATESARFPVVSQASKRARVSMPPGCTALRTAWWFSGDRSQRACDPPPALCSRVERSERVLRSKRYRMGTYQQLRHPCCTLSSRRVLRSKRYKHLYATNREPISLRARVDSRARIAVQSGHRVWHMQVRHVVVRHLVRIHQNECRLPVICHSATFAFLGPSADF